MKLHCFVSVLSAFFFVNKTKCFLVCILWSCFFLVVLCSILFFFVFSFLSKRKAQTNRTQQKAPKKKCRKKGQKQFQLARLCSQIVLLFGGVSRKMALFAENL